MHKENKLFNVTINLKLNDDVYNELNCTLKELGKINSCIVYNLYDENKLDGWRVNFNISQTNKYNTLKPCDVCKYITEHIAISKEGTNSHINCYMQPSIELLIKLYKPLIIKLAKEQHDRWRYLEMEDLIQMCNLVICDLYFKGYYVHKRLLQRAYNNYVLMHIRKDKDKPVVISLEQEYSKTDNDDKVTVADMIPDVKQLNDINDKDDEEVQSKILQEVKDIVIDFIGPRQYDQLLREYTNKQTTPWSRKLMQTIKSHLFEMGISKKSFDKYYN